MNSAKLPAQSVAWSRNGMEDNQWITFR